MCIRRYWAVLELYKTMGVVNAVVAMTQTTSLHIRSERLHVIFSS